MLDHLIVTIYGYIVSIHRLIHGFGPHVVCPHLMPTAKLTSGYPGGSALETYLALSLCVNPRIQTSPGPPSKIDAIVRYILLFICCNINYKP